MRALPPGISVRPARRDEGLRVDALIRSELVRYRDWAPEWELPSAEPELIERLTTNFGDPDRAWILVAEDDAGELVGVVSLALVTAVDAAPLPDGTVHLWQMFARRDWHGRGLGPALYDRVLEEAQRRGYTRMALWAAAGAAQARRFYEREGWTLTGAEEPNSGVGLPLVQYARALAAQK